MDTKYNVFPYVYTAYLVLIIMFYRNDNFLIGVPGKKKRKEEKLPRLAQAFSIRVAESCLASFHILSPWSALCSNDASTSATVRPY